MQQTTTSKVNKSDIIKSLSGRTYLFYRGKLLNIQNILKNTTRAVLFTEGIT